MSEAIVLTVESVRTRASTSEAIISFAIPLEQAEHVSKFMGMIGHQVGAAFVEVGKRIAKDTYGEEAKELRLSSFFRTKQVWPLIGSDEQFLDWLRNQKCAFCGNRDYVGGTGEMKCEAAHVRRVANGSGTSIKPSYSAIPLCHEHHTMQHIHGESELGDENWWRKMRIKYAHQWAWETLRETLGYDSWSEVPPEELYEWALKHNVVDFLPRAYR
jgi:hypothetical protein